MKVCELCSKVARMYCESDQASLCWDCDEKVHGANFLVARHSRSVLCHVCQSSTPWKASGPKLTPTVSVCEGCVEIHSRSICDRSICDAESEVVVDEEEEVDDDDDDDSGDDSGRDYSDGEEEDGDEDGENQVVPWSCNLSPPPPPSSSSSSEDDEEISTAVSTLKRGRENADADSDDETGFSSSQVASGAAANEEDNALGSTRAVKHRKIAEGSRTEGAQEESGSTGIISSLRRLQNDRIVDGGDATATVLGICKLSGAGDQYR